jgi:hypothetical protein
MFRLARNDPNGFGASGSSDLTLPPPTTLTEAFMAAHTDLLCQILQAQQRIAQQLQQMPLMQQKLRPSKPCSPKVPTQRDINAIVGDNQLLEGQNSMLNQMMYNIIQGRYGEPSQTSFADSLSQSLSSSMVEQARLFNLLVEYVKQDQPQASDSILPHSQLPMDLRGEERANRGSKRVLAEKDVSEWEITCKETRLREDKSKCDTSKATQLLVGETLLQATRLRKKKKKKLRLIKKSQQQISKLGNPPPRLCYNCRQPGHYTNECPNPRQQKPQQQKQNPGSANDNHSNKPSFQVKQSQLNFSANTSVHELFPHLLL